MFAIPQARQATADLVQWSREEGSLSLTPAIEPSEREHRDLVQCTDRNEDLGGGRGWGQLR